MHPAVPYYVLCSERIRDPQVLGDTRLIVHKRSFMFNALSGFVTRGSWETWPNAHKRRSWTCSEPSALCSERIRAPGSCEIFALIHTNAGHRSAQSLMLYAPSGSVPRGSWETWPNAYKRRSWTCLEHC